MKVLQAKRFLKILKPEPRFLAQFIYFRLAEYGKFRLKRTENLAVPPVFALRRKMRILADRFPLYGSNDVHAHITDLRRNVVLSLRDPYADEVPLLPTEGRKRNLFAHGKKEKTVIQKASRLIRHPNERLPSIVRIILIGKRAERYERRVRKRVAHHLSFADVHIQGKIFIYRRRLLKDEYAGIALLRLRSERQESDPLRAPSRQPHRVDFLLAADRHRPL